MSRPASSRGPDAMVQNAELVTRSEQRGLLVPALIADAGDDAAPRFVEVFTANIPNDNTQAAYAQAVAQFLRWCEERQLTLRTIEPIAVAASVKAPKHVVKKGKPPVLSAEYARNLLDSIPLKRGPRPKDGEPDTCPPD